MRNYLCEPYYFGGQHEYTDLTKTAIAESVTILALGPYTTECRYLKSAYKITSSKTSDIVLSAEFSIPKSFYIESTGHFNAVEANICLNQMSYLLFADFVSTPNAHPFWTTLGSFDLDTFKEKQLAKIFIVSLSSRFRQALDARDFRGSLRWKSVSKKMGLILCKAEFGFGEHNNSAYGEVMFAIPFH
ncbi:FcoT-like thioesterase domain-containing protein [Pseudomonas agarici]|nr:FcoT-like thioesterase domain-containing protein [Pseudomonas agarici]